MISLFARSKVTDAFVLRVPSYCVPCEEAETLRPKRELQLKWMREKGVRYLGNPSERVQKRASSQGAKITATRIVAIRSGRTEAA